VTLATAAGGCRVSDYPGSVVTIFSILLRSWDHSPEPSRVLTRSQAPRAGLLRVVVKVVVRGPVQ